MLFCGEKTMLLAAACQIDIETGKIGVNLEKTLDHIKTASDEEASLIVFPELSLTGYCFEDIDEATEMALPDDAEEISKIHHLCAQERVQAVVGFIEKCDEGLYNTTCVLGSADEPIGKYRKIHLPFIGVDRFMLRGNLGFPVYDLPSCKLGINLCYDQRFPESARCAALKGAQIIAVPTCEVSGDHELSDMIARIRAYENRVYYIFTNRVGNEYGTTYTGSSRIIGPYGELIALADRDYEQILYAELDPAESDEKKSIIDPGVYEFDIFRDRSPSDYGIVTQGIHNLRIE